MLSKLRSVRSFYFIMHYCTSLQNKRAECTCSDVVMMGKNEKIIHLNIVSKISCHEYH